jgi:hypothetical protein
VHRRDGRSSLGSDKPSDGYPSVRQLVWRFVSRSSLKVDEAELGVRHSLDAGFRQCLPLKHVEDVVQCLVHPIGRGEDATLKPFDQLQTLSIGRARKRRWVEV